MAKKPLPTMLPGNAGLNPPFVPVVVKTTVGPPPAKGLYQEAGLYLKLYDYGYNGLNQTKVISQTWRP